MMLNTFSIFMFFVTISLFLGPLDFSYATNLREENIIHCTYYPDIDMTSCHPQTHPEALNDQ